MTKHRNPISIRKRPGPESGSIYTCSPSRRRMMPAMMRPIASTALPRLALNTSLSQRGRRNLATNLAFGCWLASLELI
ncbi:MAG: hypothetical protein ABSB53_01670 [Nitrososphaerales archaeon]